MPRTMIASASMVTVTRRVTANWAIGERCGSRSDKGQLSRGGGRADGRALDASPHPAESRPARDRFSSVRGLSARVLALGDGILSAPALAVEPSRGT